MRLDLALKHSRLIKRRVVAKLYCERGLVSINGKVGKPSSEVKDGDIISVQLGAKLVEFTISMRQEGNKVFLSYEILSDKKISDA